MSLFPLKFKDARSLYAGIKKLESQDLITIKTENGKQIIARISSDLHKHFVIAKNGGLFAVQDIAQFLNNASDREIKSSTLTFILNNRGIVSLADLKVDPTLLEQFSNNLETSLITSLNLSCYTDSFLPEISDLESIHKAQSALSNTVIIKKISSENDSFSYLKRSTNMHVKAMSDGTSIAFPIPIPLEVSPHGINDTILLVTLAQNIKLKNHLLKAQIQMKGADERLALDKWIKKINEENAVIKQHLQGFIKMIKEHNEHIENANEEYQHFIRRYGSLEKAKQKNEEMDKIVEDRKHQLNQKNKKYELFKKVTAFLLFYLLPAIVLIAAGILTVLLKPILFPFWIAACVLTASLLYRYHNEFKNKIADWFSLRKEAEQLYEEIINPLNRLSSRVIFAQYYAGIKHKINEQKVEYSKGVNELEQRLEELNQREVDASMVKRTSKPQISKESLFKSKDDMWLNRGWDASQPMAINTRSL